MGSRNRRLILAAALGLLLALLMGGPDIARADSSTITIDGPPVTINVPSDGTSTLDFGSPPEGVRIFFSWTATGLSPSSGVKLIKVTGKNGGGQNCPCLIGTSPLWAGYWDTTVLPASPFGDTYRIEVSGYAGTSGTITITLNSVPDDYEGDVVPTPDGASATLSITKPGQNPYVRFYGQAGQRVFLKAANWTISSYSAISFHKDGGASFGVVGLYVQPFVDTWTIPADGDYWAVIDGLGTDDRQYHLHRLRRSAGFRRHDLDRRRFGSGRKLLCRSGSVSPVQCVRRTDGEHATLQ